MLELDLQNVLIPKDGFVLCLNYFSSGESRTWIKLDSYAENLKFRITFYDCSQNFNFCRIVLHINGQSFTLTQEMSNSWIFLCISLNILKQEISLAISNKIVFFHKFDKTLMKVPQDIKKLSIWWNNEVLGFKFPEKITLLNIYSNDRKLDKFECGEPGDLYSWNVEGWQNRVRNQNLTLLISQESTYQTCKAQFQVYALPRLNHNVSLEICAKINGNQFYENTVFQELRSLEQKRDGQRGMFWIPYTDDKEEGVWRNVYNDSTFTNITEYFALGQPNGKRWDNSLACNSKGLWDVPGLSKKYSSFCKIPKSEPYLVLRGLCLESEIESYYTAGSNNGEFIWKGNSVVSIQYTNRWRLMSLMDSADVWAESKAKYDSLLIGTHLWEIHNDSCHNESYTVYLSLRLYKLAYVY